MAKTEGQRIKSILIEAHRKFLEDREAVAKILIEKVFSDLPSELQNKENKRFLEKEVERFLEEQKNLRDIGLNEIVKSAIIGISIDEEFSIGKQGAPIEKIIQAMEERRGFSKERTLECIERLERDGDIYSPEKGRYKVVE